MRTGQLALGLVAAVITACGSGAELRTSSGSAAQSSTRSSSGAQSSTSLGQVQITYDGQIGVGSAPGHATFVAEGAISDSGTVVIAGQDSGSIVYATLTFTGSKGTFVVNEKIIKGGPHTWALSSGTGTYGGLQGTGNESGAPGSSGHIHVVMDGTVTS